MQPLLVYDCEIIKGIPGKEPPVEGIEYCAGWRDFPNMGISVIGAYDFETGAYRAFLADNFGAFAALAQQRVAIAFNGRAFDDQLVAANGIGLVTTYDPLVEIWAGAGLGPTFEFKTHGGFSLDAICGVNFGMRKTGNGALAPVLWQQGKYGTVIDYCLNDVAMEVRLVKHIVEYGWIVNPKTGVKLFVRKPGAQ